jgi:hypothetical protein
MNSSVALGEGAINSSNGGKVKGAPNRRQNGLGRPAWAHFGSVWPQFSSRLLLARFPICVHLHVGL